MNNGLVQQSVSAVATYTDSDRAKLQNIAGRFGAFA
jgi:hypothetical protein